MVICSQRCGSARPLCTRQQTTAVPQMTEMGQEQTSRRQPGSSAVLLVVAAGSVALPHQSRSSEFSFDWRLTPACHARTQTLHGRCEACCGLASWRCRLHLFWFFCLTIASLLTFGHCLLLFSSGTIFRVTPSMVVPLLAERLVAQNLSDLYSACCPESARRVRKDFEPTPQNAGRCR